MALNIGFSKNKTMKMSQIIEKAEEIFGFHATPKQKKAIKRKIQRDFIQMNYPRNNGGYDEFYVKSYLNKEKIIKYFQKFRENKPEYRNTDFLLNESEIILNEINTNQYKLAEKVGFVNENKEITLDYSIACTYSNKYLNPQEMLVLDKKGKLFLREELSEIEKIELENFWRIYNEDKEIEKEFLEIKTVVMLSALFNKFFRLDEDKLKKDIANKVHCYGLPLDSQADPTADIMRSIERLKDYRNYYTKK